MSKDISLKSIVDFENDKINFYIPRYQRGYRQGRRIKLRCPPKVLTGTLRPNLPSIFSG